jgi:uncharacterized membrane protein YedE/YeeE
MTNLASFVPPLFGGVLIGLAIATLLLLNGQIAGVSGVLGGLVHPRPGEWVWRALFVAGLVGGGLVARLVGSSRLGDWNTPLPVLAVAGALVGFGTQMAGGCTSGHGVCGVSRLSVRSIVATATFMGVAAAVVFFVHHAGSS